MALRLHFTERQLRPRRGLGYKQTDCAPDWGSAPTPAAFGFASSFLQYLFIMLCACYVPGMVISADDMCRTKGMASTAWSIPVPVLDRRQAKIQ